MDKKEDEAKAEKIDKARDKVIVHNVDTMNFNEPLTAIKIGELEIQSNKATLKELNEVIKDLIKLPEILKYLEGQAKKIPSYTR